jgi:hypothetical protein
MFSLLGITGTIDELAKTISVTVPFATNVTSLAAVFTTTGVRVNVGWPLQVSGSTTNDFTNPVVYTVTADDNTFVNYTVTVTKARNTEKAITAFNIQNYPMSIGLINESAKAIFVYMPRYTDLRALIPYFSTTGSSVTIGTSVQSFGNTPNDFLNSITTPLSYVVHAYDGSTATYAVTVTYSYTNIPKTGEMIPYYAPWDDGWLQKGAAWPSPRFTAVLSQLTTTVAWHDNLTGLIWPEDAGGSATAVKKTWQEALDYVANLNANNYLGFNDWRLPNVNEL